MALHDNDAITAFIRAKGVTRCPIACAAPTQAVVAATDRLMLRQRAERREAAEKQSGRRGLVAAPTSRASDGRSEARSSTRHRCRGAVHRYVRSTNA